MPGHEVQGHTGSSYDDAEGEARAWPHNERSYTGLSVDRETAHGELDESRDVDGGCNEDVNDKTLATVSDSSRNVDASGDPENECGGTKDADDADDITSDNKHNFGGKRRDDGDKLGGEGDDNDS
ncbi:hypothetical protein PHLGIDRAFT_123481 [Phlebiopsis gigantea 11061_1 CR5-6]|uniref:Uncharacterized protein n=1 Tax=Phlebiopsis gigantea (strain 11061_1 CR5-6) TaxID=745531 RepID=A0A0C3RPC8_PHLG1|nr:hypothetical protein PHLGIDRAFT_123481 [Phlebiopsis gigantea 11061_1 CR5-6]